MGITNEDWDQIRAAAKEVQPDDHEYLEEELWQSIRVLFENAEASTNDELGVVIESEYGRNNSSDQNIGNLRVEDICLTLKKQFCREYHGSSRGWR